MTSILTVRNQKRQICPIKSYITEEQWHRRHCGKIYWNFLIFKYYVATWCLYASNRHDKKFTSESTIFFLFLHYINLFCYRNIVANITQTCYHELRLTSETTPAHQDILPLILPLYHIYGLTVCMAVNLW